MLQFAIMLATTHAIVGALFATQISDPAVAISAAIISHPLLDLFPHWDFNSRWSTLSKVQKFWISAVDSGFGMIVGFLLFANWQNWIFLTSMMLLAQWPDFLEFPYHFGFEKNWFFKRVKLVQHLWHTKAPWPWGFIPQLGIILLAFWLRFNI